jgi:hypothetical protein
LFGSLFEKTASWLGPRAVVTLLLPSLVFWIVVGAVVATRAGWATALGAWHRLDPTQQVLAAVAAISGIAFFAMALGQYLSVVVRWYEGYWGISRPARWLAGLGCRLERRRWQRLDVSKLDGYTRRYQQFPVYEVDVLPTRLGNVLRACETYASDQQRYGMDAVFFWPRLYAVLPDAMRAALMDARIGVEFMLVMSGLASIITALLLVIACGSGPDWTRWVVVAVGSAALSYGAYRLAVRAAVTYAEFVRSSVDVYRRDLLAAIGLALPTTLEMERALWRALGQQLYRRGADDEALLVFRSER